MNRYSQINEDYDLGKLKITTNQFYNYKSFIDSILNLLYDPSKRENIPDLGLFIKALPSEKSDGREFSILNKINTNLAVLRFLVKELDPIDYDNLKYIINDLKNDIFFEDGKYFQEIRRIIKGTESVGERNEILVMEYIKNIVKVKFNQDVEMRRSPTSSYKDLILGVDVEFNLNGKEYTCQVKPLVSKQIIGEFFQIESSGNIKKYKTNYIAFSNFRTSEVLLFQNKEVSFVGKSIKINKSFLVH